MTGCLETIIFEKKYDLLPLGLPYLTPFISPMTLFFEECSFSKMLIVIIKQSFSSIYLLLVYTGLKVFTKIDYTKT